VARVQRVGAPDDERLRAAEQRRRGEIVERLGEDRRIAVAPQRPALPAEALPEQAEPALDQEGLVTVEEERGVRRGAGQRGQRIPLRRRPAQNASTAYT